MPTAAPFQHVGHDLPSPRDPDSLAQRQNDFFTHQSEFDNFTLNSLALRIHLIKIVSSF